MTARKAYEKYLATSGASQWLSWEGWQAAYAAGMERAAEICDGMGNSKTLRVEDCAAAILAEIKGE